MLQAAVLTATAVVRTGQSITQPALISGSVEMVTEHVQTVTVTPAAVVMDMAMWITATKFSAACSAGRFHLEPAVRDCRWLASTTWSTPISQAM